MILNTMGHARFPSGRWAGYYLYGGDNAQHPMSARLKFTGGTLFGEGSDEIGAFTFSGWYSEESGDCAWVKRYVGAHDVDYRGARDGKGIWGTWSIGAFRGGFHLWPEQDEKAALEQRRETEATTFPHASTVL